MNREIVTLDSGGLTLVGTRYPAGTGRPTAAVVLLNAGAAPRSGNADLHARMAAALSAGGIDCFTFDLPGVGDSGGPSFATLEDFWQAVQAGYQDSAVREIVGDVRRRIGTAPLLLGGVCAGAISAIRFCARSPREADGMVLIEPNFRRFVYGRPPSEGQSDGRWRRFIREAASMAPSLRQLRSLANRIMGRPSYPPDVNPAHLGLWRDCLGKGVPSLLICCAGGTSETICNAVLRRAARDRPVERASIGGTNHILTEGDGAVAATRLVTDWSTRRARPGTTKPVEPKNGAPGVWSADPALQ